MACWLENAVVRPSPMRSEWPSIANVTELAGRSKAFSIARTTEPQAFRRVFAERVDLIGKVGGKICRAR